MATTRNAFTDNSSHSEGLRFLRPIMLSAIAALAAASGGLYGGAISSGGGRSQIGNLVNTSSVGSSFATGPTQIGSNTNLSGLVQVLYVSGPVQGLDSDGDMIPDQWEASNGLNTGANDAGGDLDGDGVSNLSEYIAGTNPQSGQSKFATTISRANSTYSIGFQTVAGRTYEIEGSTDLTNWVALFTQIGSGSFETVPFNVASADFIALVGPAAATRCFFRVKISINQ
jgi:hypothetical protein